MNMLQGKVGKPSLNQVIGEGDSTLIDMIGVAGAGGFPIRSDLPEPSPHQSAPHPLTTYIDTK